MQRVDRDAVTLQLLGEIDGEQDLGEFTLAIGPVPAVVMGQHYIVEVDLSAARLRRH